jgi:uncharacterized protein YdaU (DUF1376 family)
VNYYPFHIGDFRSGTVNMSRLSRWIYRDMLDVYYDSEKPLPLDVDVLCDQIGVESADERAVVERLLRFKFVKADDGYRHGVCDRLISEYQEKAAIARANGKRGGRKTKQSATDKEPTGFQSGSDPDAIGNPLATESQANQEPVTNNQEPTPTPPNPLVAEGEPNVRRRRRRDSQMSLAMAERFERFYAGYPRKEARVKAEAAFSKIAPDDELLATMLAAIAVHRQKRQWADPEAIPHPATWLNQKRWADQAAVCASEYTDDERAVIDAYNVAMPADWSPAERDVFVPSRAAAIRDFLSLAPDKPDMPERYFAHCAENLAADPRYGFEWLIKRETYAKVREGAVKMKESA